MNGIDHFPLIHPRDEIMQTMERIYQYRMTTTSGGNISIGEPNGDIWITPARVDKGTLRRDDIICVRANGKIEGRHEPSSEFPFHQAIYRARPDIRAVVHAHSVGLVAFSVCRAAPDTRLFHQARHVCGEVGVAKYASPGTPELGAVIAEKFQQGHHCVVLENHGVVVGGEDLQQAFQRFETLEFTAKTIIKARLLGDVHYLTDQQVEMPAKAAPALPTFPVRPASSEEKELRRQLVDFVRRGYRQRLLISTEGSFSARLDEQSFLMTPYRVDRNTVTVEDIVLIRNGAAEAGKHASRATRTHAAIYQHHPSIRAIVNAYTVNATAFSVSAQKLDTRTIPESYIVLRNAGYLPHGRQFNDLDAVAAAVSPESPSLIMENEGVLVCGVSILDAFGRLEVLEATAEAVINARHLGEIAPMEPSIIADLEHKYLSGHAGQHAPY